MPGINSLLNIYENCISLNRVYYILKLIPYYAGEERVYLSANSIDRSEFHDNTITDVLTPEFLSTLRTSGLPNHKIKLKVGCPIMLLRNIDQSEGLCNGTR